MAALRVASVRFSHYKAFSSFSVQLHEFNVLVGPNNSGKSTIIGAFRILHEGLRKARSKSPDRVVVETTVTLGYRLNIEDLPVAAENIFHDYDESQPAVVAFKLSNGNVLKLHFPERGQCLMVAEPISGFVRSPKEFRTAFDIEIAFVPILGPVEQRERLFAKEAARLALLTSGASRNFRNIWFHYPEEFDRFRDLVQATWPGMDIQRPELSEDCRDLWIFCPEERRPREICWSGYGFQVWCQMLTFIVKGSGASLLVIDEPDIYLHSDLQRQLVALLRVLGPDILIATHSTEIIAECEPTSLLNIDKRNASASRVKDASQLKRVFAALGSNLNPTLTQLAKTRRVVFVEGLDFQILGSLARTLGKQRLANRADFAIVQADSRSPRRVIDLAQGIENTLGRKVLCVAILDRGYRSDAELAEISSDLAMQGVKLHVHQRKELENHLLVADAIQRALEGRIAERARRTGVPVVLAPSVKTMLDAVVGQFRHEVFANLLAWQSEFRRRATPGLDLTALNEGISRTFEKRWAEPGGSVAMVPGKEVLSRLNALLIEQCGVTVTDAEVAAQIRRSEMAPDLVHLIEVLARFSDEAVPEHDSSAGQLPTTGLGAKRAGSNAGDDEHVRESLKRQDAAIASHNAIDAGADWGDVPANLPRGKGRRS